MRAMFLVLIGLGSAVVGACSSGPASKSGAPNPPPAASTTNPPPAPGPSADAGAPSPQSYSVGGTVTGLLRPGLKLALNGMGDISVDHDGPFAFAAPVGSGASYDVTASQQPPGETCSVSNGNGTMASGAVSDVMVQCSPLSYAIGGTITGLQGTVVIQNNGADDLSIAADGTFAFATPIPSGGTYAVSVLTQPSGPNQTCVVSNGSDTVVSSDVANITIACTTNAYSVNVQVSGVQGAGLLLQDNGADDLSIPSDGTYAFATQVVDGQQYAVSVLTQPSNPAQTCTADAPGTINGADVTVNVSCQ